MKTRLKRIALLLSAPLILSGAQTAAAAPAPAIERDIVIYSASSAGVAAAVQAVRMGKSVVIVEPGDRVGGLTTGGLGQTDIGNKQAIGGISLEFYKAVARHYGAPASWNWEPRAKTRVAKHRLDGESMWVFEPSAALGIYESWLRRDGIEVVKNERLDRTNGAVWQTGAKDAKRLAAFRTESGREFRGKVFIDASYEGDLMALLGVSYTVGREANALYGETLNGVQTKNSGYHQFATGVDPYVRKGDPASGLLPFIDANGPGEEGAGDRRVQAYCFRMCLTDHPENRIPFAKPDGYREDWYELLFRNYEAGAPRTPPWINSPMPNRKTDTNNRNGFSTDFIGENYDYPEADYATREKIVARHLLYQQGLMWTLANHPRVPKEIRDQVSKWGMTKDEFPETGNGWQKQLYIREARRMVGSLVMTQHHCQGRETVDDSIGMAAYTMDSHHVQRHIDRHGHVRNEGDVQVKGFPPYPVSYRSLIPREGECENLLVPICMSASHIAYGSIRMEPVFMIFGQSAATAAAIAIDDKVPVQKVNYAKLREKLLKDGQVLAVKAAAMNDSPLAASLNALKSRGVIKEPSYWLQNARPGKTCNGAYVGELIIKAVSVKKPVASIEEACDHLQAAGLLQRSDYWKKSARKGRTCSGQSVAALIPKLDTFTSR